MGRSSPIEVGGEPDDPIIARKPDPVFLAEPGSGGGTIRAAPVVLLCPACEDALHARAACERQPLELLVGGLVIAPGAGRIELRDGRAARVRRVRAWPPVIGRVRE